MVSSWNTKLIYPWSPYLLVSEIFIMSSTEHQHNHHHHLDYPTSPMCNHCPSPIEAKQTYHLSATQAAIFTRTINFKSKNPAGEVRECMMPLLFTFLF